MRVGLDTEDTASPGELDKTRQIEQDMEFYAEQRKLKSLRSNLIRKYPGTCIGFCWLELVSVVRGKTCLALLARRNGFVFLLILNFWIFFHLFNRPLPS